MQTEADIQRELLLAFSGRKPGETKIPDSNSSSRGPPRGWCLENPLSVWSGVKLFSPEEEGSTNNNSNDQTHPRVEHIILVGCLTRLGGSHCDVAHLPRTLVRLDLTMTNFGGSFDFDALPPHLEYLSVQRAGAGTDESVTPPPPLSKTVLRTRNLPRTLRFLNITGQTNIVGDGPRGELDTVNLPPRIQLIADSSGLGGVDFASLNPQTVGICAKDIAGSTTGEINLCHLPPSLVRLRIPQTENQKKIVVDLARCPIFAWSQMTIQERLTWPQRVLRDNFALLEPRSFEDVEAARLKFSEPKQQETWYF